MTDETISSEEFNAACSLVRRALAVLEDNGTTLAQSDRHVALRMLSDALDEMEDARERHIGAQRRQVDHDDEVRRDQGD